MQKAGIERRNKIVDRAATRPVLDPRAADDMIIGCLNNRGGYVPALMIERDAGAQHRLHHCDDFAPGGNGQVELSAPLWTSRKRKPRNVRGFPEKVDWKPLPYTTGARPVQKRELLPVGSHS